MIQRKITVGVVLSPDELAFEFANMGDEQQAMFFNELAAITAKWERPFCFQLQYIIEHPALTKEGRSIMQDIGNYGAVQDEPQNDIQAAAGGFTQVACEG